LNAAAIIGNEFKLDVMNHILGYANNINAQLDYLSNLGYFKQMKGMKDTYQFSDQTL
jgi:hypothetical protein